jgi:hypothetical protein
MILIVSNDTQSPSAGFSWGFASCYLRFSSLVFLVCSGSDVYTDRGSNVLGVGVEICTLGGVPHVLLTSLAHEGRT